MMNIISGTKILLKFCENVSWAGKDLVGSQPRIPFSFTLHRCLAKKICGPTQKLSRSTATEEFFLHVGIVASVSHFSVVLLCMLWGLFCLLLLEHLFSKADVENQLKYCK